MAASLRQTSFGDFRISVRNQSALIANIHKFEEDLLDEVRDRVVHWGTEIRDFAIELAPIGKDTDPAPHPGFLKAHIEDRYSPDFLSVEVGCWAEHFDAIGENLYAIFQEYGTSQHDAQPFLNPAFDYLGPQMVADVTGTIRRLARERGASGSG